MIGSIDENIGRLVQRLEELGIADDTILIFMTDNGSCGGSVQDDCGFITQGYNAGMRGKKGSLYDGGHRVPFFIRWPNGGIPVDTDVAEMVTHMDLLPTFIDLCGLTAPDGLSFDGMSFAPLLLGEDVSMPDREVFVQFRQYTEPPDKWTNAVMTPRWRLVYGKELYDIKADPGQQHDVAAQHPDVVNRLREAHERWWEEVSPAFKNYCPISLGNDHENPTCLDAMDVMGDVAWNQGHILKAQKSTGRWTVDVEKPGEYRFGLRRWPKELALPIGAAVNDEQADKVAPFLPEQPVRTIHPVRARLSLFGEEVTTDVAKDSQEAAFTLTIEKTGVTELEAWFDAADGESQGAYYVYVERA